MALPGHSRAYKFHTRVIPHVGVGDNGRATLWAIKDAIVGGGDWTDANGDSTSAPDWWTVTGSANSSTSGHDAVDRWPSAEAMGATTDSFLPWIVLANASIDFSFVLRKNNSGTWGADRDVQFHGCASASGGSTTTAPTLTSSLTLHAGGANDWAWSSSAATRMYMWQSELGFKIMFARNGWIVGHGYLEALRDVYGDASPIVGAMRGTNNASPSAHLTTGLLSAQARRIADAGEQQLTLTSLNDLGAPSSPDYSGEYILRPLIAYSTQSGELGPRGWIADRYAVVTASDKLGFPDDDEPTWVSIAGYAWPWNKTALSLAAT